jgi:hypothetical protein
MALLGRGFGNGLASSTASTPPPLYPVKRSAAFEQRVGQMSVIGSGPGPVPAPVQTHSASGSGAVTTCHSVGLKCRNRSQPL